MVNMSGSTRSRNRVMAKILSEGIPWTGRTRDQLNREQKAKESYAQPLATLQEVRLLVLFGGAGEVIRGA